MLEITDLTLCTIELCNNKADAACVFYKALLSIGVTYVQIPMSAVGMLGDDIDKQRTVLKVPLDAKHVPKGFGGYVHEKMSRSLDRRGHSNGNRQALPPNARVSAGASLFMNDYRKTFEKLVALPNASFCAKNAGDAGTALTVEWILAGGQRTAASFMGSGGYAPLEQVLAALKTSGYPLPNIDLSYLRQAAKAWERLTDESVATHQPVLGSRLFDVESGVHVDGIIKNNRCYEPFEPEQVGAQRRIIIGKHTGKRALALKLKELGLDVRADLDRLLELVREAAMEQGGSLDDSAFAALAERVKGDDAA